MAERTESGLKSAETVAPATQPGHEPQLDGSKDQDLNTVEDEADRNWLNDTNSNATDAKPWYKQANPLRWGRTAPVPRERSVSPEYNAGFFSKLTFQWMTPLMVTGYKRQLQKNDLWKVNPDRAVEPLTRKVKESFHRRVRNGDKHPLLWALHDTFKVEFWQGGFCALMTAVVQVMAPFTLRFLIQFATDAYIANVEGRSAPPIKNGIGLAFGITIMQIFQSVCASQFIYRGMMIGAQTRGVLIGVIYEKAMVISDRAKVGGVKATMIPEKHNADQEENGKDTATEEKSTKKNRGGNKNHVTKEESAGWNNGRIHTLMSVDTNHIDRACGLFHMMWTSPIICLITLILLLINLTYSALAGFALLIIGVPALTKAVRVMSSRRKAINKVTDKRVSLTQEILRSVRLVKFFAWEKAFISQLEQFRSEEIHSVQLLLAVRNALTVASLSLPIFASMLSLIAYSLSNHKLAPATVFSSLALFTALRVPLNMLPNVLSHATDAWSSLKRIEEFLMQEEHEEDAIYKPEGSSVVEMIDAAFTWERTAKHDSDKDTSDGAEKDRTKTFVEDQANRGTFASKLAETQDSSRKPEQYSASTLVEEREPFQLQGLNFQINRNELVAVIGTVGSGKSSLLAALAGEMRKTSGDVILGASRAFCPQCAWIQSTTLQNNITFGKDMDRDWYSRVIQACALLPDLDMLPDGDETEIGERGITISGGQKQRLNIARAIYFDADIVIMDDPLSAVDAHVGRHIFDNAILGLLKNKCRILATHQHWVLSRCDRIIWMNDGKIRTIDTFANLIRHDQEFQKLMETTGIEEKEQKPETTVPMDLAGEPKWRKKNKAGAVLMQQEEKAESGVPWSVYAAYARASGSILNAPLVMTALIVSQAANIVTGLWLSWWTSDKFGYSAGTYIGIYAALGAVQAVLTFASAVSLSILGTNSSKVMLRDAVQRVLRAPMSFFDTTPLGRITNRFSRDVSIMDNNLTESLRMYMLPLCMITAVFALIIAYFHWFAIVLIPLYSFFVLSASYYRASAREVKRFESILRSDVSAKFDEGLSGVSSIRAYGLKMRFIGDLQSSIDDVNSAYYLTFPNQRWLSVRLDMVSSALVLTVAILVVTSRFSVHPSTGGLVLTHILAIVQMLQFIVRQLADVENGMNSVERLHYYATQLEEEAPLHTVHVSESWPEKGEIVFDSVEMRYRENLPLVLQGLSMHIRGGERIGIVGRTGAGKSSITTALFRLVEVVAGTITIDGIDISTIGLHDLRSRLSIIPQDPTFFQGTVRSNLDPFNEHDDADLWSALHQANISSAEASAEFRATNPSLVNLDTVVREDGLNFSLGQRQLMALARALVRRSQIIVCDEATSSVDMATDDKIQKTMATAFKGKTLICIAHRLHTVIGYDRICVMEAGQIAEMDTPLALWHQGGIFRGMCDRSGIRQQDIQGAKDGLAALDAVELHK
ncbi:hypothetical protein ED733_003923 [Metarhizium rileyi]|uniref:ABC transporter family protein n=1 Tax=Metarhizium rileyi (strain RCEF 4871) TaxID=1649241 RepID=A0A5C6G7P6_METRR|nr:hypothetical protein ED733_003923 [Metarhizium rileyi]